VEFVTHKPGMAIDEFQRYWLEVHGPLAAAIPWYGAMFRATPGARSMTAGAPRPTMGWP